VRVLERDQTALAAPLLSAVRIRSHLAFAHCLIEGRQGGAVYVDSHEAPATAMLCGVSGFWFAVGMPDRALLGEFEPPAAADSALFATSAEWRELLDQVYGGHLSRLGFVPEDASPPAATLPDGFHLQPADARLAERPSELDSWVVRLWGGPQRFAAESFGYFAVPDGRPIAMAVACAIGGGEAEMEVGTVPEFRRSGLARAACSAFMGECRRRGLRPAWSCASENAPSRELALRLGFRQVEEVFGYPLA